MTTVFRIADDYGTDLSSRYRAAGLRQQVIDSAHNGQAVHIDFAGVRTLSDSFADELFGILVLERGDEWFREKISVLNLSPPIRTTILEAVADRLESRELAR